MLIFPNQALVVLATPKTGTTALEKALRPKAGIVFAGKPSIKHMRYQTYLKLLDAYLESQIGRRPTTCAAMRHPLDWLSSWYRYRRRDELAGTPNSTAHVSFDEFVDAYLQPERPAFASVGSQSRFLTLKDGSRQVDRIFRYEGDALIRFLQDRLDTPIRLQRTNISPEFDAELSPPVLARLHEAYALDFSLYDAAET